MITRPAVKALLLAGLLGTPTLSTDLLRDTSTKIKISEPCFNFFASGDDYI
jgi:hypothetical protein